MSTEEIRSDWIGRIIDGRFTLQYWLGGSGPGGVFLTQAGDPPESAAIKLIPAGTADAASLLAQWTAAERLSHPNLMRIFTSGRCSVGKTDLIYAVTEYSGEILSEILPARPLTTAEVGNMLQPILTALLWLHRRVLVHGGLKPSNIMVVNEQLKLSVDRVQFAGPRVIPLTSPSIHDAPESAEKVSPQVDIWSLGVLIVEALTQQPPRWDGSRATDPVIPASIPEPYGAIARRCLCLDPARRCSLAEIKTLLTLSTVSAPAPAPKPVPVPRPPAPLPERPIKTPPPASVNIGSTPPANRRATITIVIALLLIAAVVGVIVVRRRSGNPSSSRPTPSSATSNSEAPASGAATGPTVHGAVTHRALPDVAPSAAATIQGHIHISVLVQVDSNGNVTQADFESRGPSRYFANLALNSARNWKFNPAQINGRAVPSTWLLHFSFAQTGTDITPVETNP